MAEERLDSNVQEILQCVEGKQDFLLSGGAGCGKTYALVLALRELSKKYPHIHIACITYTNAAADEIKERANIPHLTVQTIHDFLWSQISSFPNEMKDVLEELVNAYDEDTNKDTCIKNPDPSTKFLLLNDVIIQYREYNSLSEGIISHDEVLKLSKAMYEKYDKLRMILCDKYQCIFVDEYQDTSPLVINILLDYKPTKGHKNVIGFFGDSMQSIYEGSVGNIQDYTNSGVVKEIQRTQNRRNPASVISLANKIRDDGLVQEPSKDVNAPNMENGNIRKGRALFLYSSTRDIADVRESSYCDGWRFTNGGNLNENKDTKELRLTNNLISQTAGFHTLYNAFRNDAVIKWCEKNVFPNFNKAMDDQLTLETFLQTNDVKPMKAKNDYDKDLFEFAKKMKVEKLRAEHFNSNNDSLTSTSITSDGVIQHQGRTNPIVDQLFKIQNIISLYKNNYYNEFIRLTDWTIEHSNDKLRLQQIMNELIMTGDKSIKEVIDFMNGNGLCKKDDKFDHFVRDHEYLYFKVGSIPFSEFQGLYDYQEAYTPYSTQHKVKGLEYDHVLVLLDNGRWNMYNFEKFFKYYENTSNSVIKRTKNLFYVCCTRAKKDFIAFYRKPSKDVVNAAKELFGEDNVINLELDNKV